jgi:hypothetical protein
VFRCSHVHQQLMPLSEVNNINCSWHRFNATLLRGRAWPKQRPAAMGA